MTRTEQIVNGLPTNSPKAVFGGGPTAQKVWIIRHSTFNFTVYMSPEKEGLRTLEEQNIPDCYSAVAYAKVIARRFAIENNLIL